MLKSRSRECGWFNAVFDNSSARYVIDISSYAFFGRTTSDLGPFYYSFRLWVLQHTLS